VCIAVGLSAAVRVACEKNGGARGSGTILKYAFVSNPFRRSSVLRSVPFVFPRTSPQTSHSSAISKVRRRGSQKEQERGEWARLQNTIFLSPERWRSLIAVLGAHELTAFVKVLQALSLPCEGVVKGSKSTVLDDAGILAPHADARAAAWRRARTSGVA
jgi:hypothetical protein